MTRNTSATITNQTLRHNKSRAHAPARRDSVVDGQLEKLTRSLYFDAKCGNAAAEYNLEKAGVIEMIQGHVAGQMREGDNYWDDCRWEITKLGRCTSMAEARRIILGDPPLEIALWDAMDEARDVADRCGGYEPDDPYVLMHRRILTHLLDRVERIRAAESHGTQ